MTMAPPAERRGLLCSLLMGVWLSSSSPLFSFSSFSAKADQTCVGSRCCLRSHCAPGPLNLTQPTIGFDSPTESQPALIYHCLRFFTTFRWYSLQRPDDADYFDDRVDENDSRLEPFPWGQRGRVWYLPGRSDNQTVLIPKVRREKDSGLYVFVAGNGSHRVAGKFWLKVDCRQPGPSFATSEQPVQPVQLGANKTLRCAVNLADCAGKFYQSNVFWIWRNSTSARRLENDTLSSVSVVCDRGNYVGGKCDVSIRHVGEELFDGEFVCKIDRSPYPTQTVRLVQIQTEVKSSLRYVLGCTGGAVLLLALIGVTWCKRHSVAFYCRTSRDAGDFDAHVVILHGEDQERVVREVLGPGVRALGYTILNEGTRPGRLEVTENLKAVKSSHTVLLAFSARELAEQGRIRFLTRYVFRCKNRSTVLFVRCPSDDSDDDNTNDDDHHRVVKNPWNNSLPPFKVVHMPRSLLLHAGAPPDGGLKEAGDAERFWCGLRKHLPRVSPGRSPPGARGPGWLEGRRERGRVGSTDSRQPLMDDHIDGVEGVGSRVPDFGTFPSSCRTAGGPYIEA